MKCNSSGVFADETEKNETWQPFKLYNIDIRGNVIRYNVWGSAETQPPQGSKAISTCLRHSPNRFCIAVGQGVPKNLAIQFSTPQWEVRFNLYCVVVAYNNQGKTSSHWTKTFSPVGQPKPLHLAKHCLYRKISRKNNNLFISWITNALNLKCKHRSTSKV